MRSGHLPYLICLLLFYSAASTTATTLKFKEAPQFYNSPNCPPPLPASSSATCNPNTLVHVSLTLDVAYLRGSIAAIQSILRHSSCPQSIQFHFIASYSITYLNSTIFNSFPYLNFRIYPFDEDRVSGRISTSIREALDRPLNYARSYLPHILPTCVTRVIYLDSDLILVDDIANLYSTHLPEGIALAAPEYCNANFTAYFTDSFWSNPSMTASFEGRNACYFNTGVMVMDLGMWRANMYTRLIEQWMDAQKRFRIYELGSLPPFLLVFAGRIAGVDHRWNQHGLGGDNYNGLCRELHPGPVEIIYMDKNGEHCCLNCRERLERVLTQLGEE